MMVLLNTHPRPKIYIWQISFTEHHWFWGITGDIIQVLLGMRKWNTWSDWKNTRIPRRSLKKKRKKNAGCIRGAPFVEKIGLKESNLTLKWELKLKSHELILFESKSLNSAACSGACWVCVNLNGSNPKWLWLPQVPLCPLVARDMRKGAVVFSRQLSSVYTLICNSFWLLLRTTKWDLDSLKCNYESIGLDSRFYPWIHLYLAKRI